AKTLVTKQIAMDGIAVVVNKENTIDSLTSDQIKSIYLGESTTWEDVQ
ncbi:MAG: substrate-binding domain-containing protein, partial [Ruminococcus sp.]